MLREKCTRSLFLQCLIDHHANLKESLYHYVIRTMETGRLTATEVTSEVICGHSARRACDNFFFFATGRERRGERKSIKATLFLFPPSSFSFGLHTRILGKFRLDSQQTLKSVLGILIVLYCFRIVSHRIIVLYTTNSPAKGSSYN